MIFEMVVTSVQNLKGRWTDLHDELERLRDLIAAGMTHNQIDSLLPGIDTVNNAIDDPSEGLDGLTDLATLLANARTIFNESYLALGTVDATMNSLFPVLLASTDQQIVTLSTTIQLKLVDQRRVIERALQDLEEIRTPEGGRATLTGIRSSVDNISTFPVLTQETGYAVSAPAPAGGSPPGGASLGQLVDGTLRDILGWRPKAGDSKGFAAALTQSFTCKEVSGRSYCDYTPRSFAVQVQADLGAITGAQQSLYARAKAALDESLKLIDRIYALDPAADPEEDEASRAIIRSELTELVNELGVEGGPRVQRVDTLFDLLAGITFTADPNQVQGELRRFRDVFGLTAVHVNTINEEQDLTDFLTLLDYVISLRQSWNAIRDSFDANSTAQKFLGTQLVLLSRTLAVISESVQEVYFAMDSVFLGSAERLTIRLDFTFAPSILVGELLGWVDRFASEEGPRLIQDGGKAGVGALFPTVDRLAALVHGALIPPQDANRLPVGYRTSRVQRAVEELADYLDRAASLARAVL